MVCRSLWCLWGSHCASCLLPAGANVVWSLKISQSTDLGHQKKKSWLMFLFKALNLLNLWTIIFSTSFEYLVKKQLLGLFLKLSSRHLSISGPPGGLWLNKIHNRESVVLCATQLIRKIAHYLPVENPIFLGFQTSAWFFNIWCVDGHHTSCSAPPHSC